MFLLTIRFIILLFLIHGLTLFNSCSYCVIFNPTAKLVIPIRIPTNVVTNLVLVDIEQWRAEIGSFNNGHFHGIIMKLELNLFNIISSLSQVLNFIFALLFHSGADLEL